MYVAVNVLILRLSSSTKAVKLGLGLGAFLFKCLTANLSMPQSYFSLEQLISKVIHHSLESLSFIFMTLLIPANNLMKLFDGRL